MKYDDEDIGAQAEIASLRAKLEKTRATIDNLWRVFKRERMDDMCSADDDDLTVSDIARATLEEGE